LKYLFILTIFLVFIGCSTKKVQTIEIEKFQEKNETIVKNIPIYDLENIPQNTEFYSKNINQATLYNIQNKYYKSYFTVWNLENVKASLNEIKWPFSKYNKTTSYGENLQPLENDFFNEMLIESNFKNYATINKNGITVKLSNIRSFPTIRPLLKDPSKAGEGFPFDYIQNSTIQANKPIFVSHYSLNKEWVYIFTSFTSGWIKTNNMVFLDKKYTKVIEESKQVKITKDNIPIYDENEKFLFNSKIGMNLALIEETQDNYIVLTISSYKNQEPLYNRSKISKNMSSLNTLIFNNNNLSNILDNISNTNYGWGGLYEQRDCSSTLRDFFAPFGIWLPRNSYQQSKIGKIVSLENLDSQTKVKLIKEKAIPFKTLLYKKGHILLYVGIYNDEIVVFHNTWGIKTYSKGIEGRKIIGKPIFSSLQLGKNQTNYDKESELLENLKSMNILIK